MALCSMEAVKDGIPKFIKSEDALGLYKEFVPLWGCQIPFIKKLGVRGLFTRELALLILMIGTLTGAQWGIYYVFNVFIGLLSSPL
ncbi:putative mitochondrial carrier domain protein [Helianthus annuus]|uniref:Mitochondrial carrier domain protein n=1 Tax=Helianthus annuus TaxID=4232 RepID=A0A251SYL3_HELAN|nr:putative mitochondrial carrier domain protein [Helianthus annuus]